MAINHWLSSTAIKGIAVAGITTMAAMSAAGAAPVIVTLNPSAVGLSTQGPFQADNYSLSDFATASIDNATGAFTESGTLRLNTWLLGSQTIGSATSGLGNGTGAGSYGLYITFTATGNLPGFTPGTPPPPVNGSFSSISYSLLGDPGNTNTVDPTGVLTDNGAADILLATGGLSGGFPNAVGITGAGVPTADVLLTLVKTAAGSAYIAPPTVGQQEISFTNTVSVATFTNLGASTGLAINGGGGNGTFAVSSTPIPEPASLLVVGSGLVGLGLVRRFRKKS